MSIVQPELFTEQVDQALNRLVEMVDKRTASSHISLGLWKNRRGEIQYNAMLAVQDKEKCMHTKTLQGSSFSHLTEQINEFLTTLPK
jgi:uncharacterized protein YdgA (DUF945 family)